jgi:hypothetical protein
LVEHEIIMQTPMPLLEPHDSTRITTSPVAASNPRLDRFLPWYSFPGADVVLLLVALLVFLTARQGLLDDPGLGWHLRNIDVMLAQKGWLTIDPFTEPRDGQARPWYSNQWLGELPFWLGEYWAGREGIAAVAALLVGFTIRSMYRMVLRDGAPWPVAVFWASQAAMGISCSWVARPNLFTLLFVMVTARVCVLYHEGRCSRRSTLWLLPLFALWANLHGGFLAGFLLLGATFLIELVLALLAGDPWGRDAARRRAGHLFLLLSGSFLCTLLNPYGISLYRWLFQLIGDPFFMDLHLEWKSPDFHGKGAIRFEWLMLLFPLLPAVSKRRPNLVELGLALIWFHFALTGFRYVPLWVVVAVPFLARSSLGIPAFEEWVRRHFRAGGDSEPVVVPRDRLPWLHAVVVTFLVLTIARFAEGRIARHQPEILPTEALDHFLQLHEQWRQAHGHRPIVFHSYDWGGYLIWHGGPGFRNWIDDRNEVQGKEHIQEYFDILETKPGWSDKLDTDKVQLICIQTDAPLTFRLAERKSVWLERYRDSHAVIFERVCSAR